MDTRIRSFGHQLTRAGILILRIDNPVLHDKLETNRVFLQNQVAAIQNLLRLKAIYPEIETKLTHVITQLDKYRTSILVAQSFILIKNPIVRNLLGKNPSLAFLHFFKIGTYLLERGHTKKEKRPS
ncbi:MAG: hypothetical protein IPL46_24820 [Saprospiraceae bacterium]|nr:hypothetical protein [Saprospiraceae bacterium]